MKFLQDVFNFIEAFKTADAYLNQVISKQLLKPESEQNLLHDCFEESFKERSAADDCFENYAKSESVIKSQELQTVNNTEILSTQDAKQHICNICGNHFVRLSGLKRHMKIHLGIKSFKCDKCNKTFQEKLALKRHILIHTGL